MLPHGNSDNLNNLLTSSQRNGTKIAKGAEKFKRFSNSTNENRVSQTQDYSQAKTNEQGDRQESDTHVKIIIEKEKQSLTPTKRSKKQGNGNIASLEEMISETTVFKHFNIRCTN